MIDFIKDADCTKETPVKLGVPDAPIYGKGIKLKPRVDGRTDSEHFKKIYLPELLPLEEYDLIVVLISGGKDSVACYLKLLELGVPKERIEFWHHDIDGGHPSRRMDWKCTQNYVKALADAEGIKLRVSYRVNGFFGELYRIGASEPIEWIDPDTGEVKQCKLSSNYLKCKELKEQATEEMEELLKKYGYRMKFPAKTGDLSRRWCSAYLKICVADTVVSNLDRLGELEELGGKRHKFPAKGGTHSGRWCSGNLKAAVQDSVTANLEETKRDKKILIVSGERRGESAGRSKYNEMEIHRTNAEAKAHVTMTDAAGNVQVFNWQRVPLIPLKANEQETPLIKKVKSLQDGINVMLSDFENNMQEDARNTILVLKNYDGTNLGEFRKNLATYGAVKVRYDGDTKGGVETLEITVNAENYKTIVEIFKKALIENAMGYDAKDDRLSGNPNQMNIQSMYSDIDTDANDTESEAQATMDDVLWFVNCHLANTGQGDFEGEEDGVDVVFNRDMLMNESDIIDNCQKSQGIISDETIISMHPWVDDPQLEMERLKKQKEEAQKEMLAQYDPFGTQNQNGDGADDDPDNKGDPSQGSQGGEVDE